MFLRENGFSLFCMDIFLSVFEAERTFSSYWGNGFGTKRQRTVLCSLTQEMEMHFTAGNVLLHGTAETVTGKNEVFIFHFLQEIRSLCG